MGDNVNTLEGALQNSRIGNAARDELDIGWQPDRSAMRMDAGFEAVEDTYGVALPQEAIHQMPADEASASGHQNSHVQQNLT